jgi:DNA topoisomerase-1
VRLFFEPMQQQLQRANDSDERVEVPVVETDRACPTCGATMVRRTGRYGEFLACSRYPECKTTLPVGATGVRCPVCNTGEIVQRKSKKGRVFYSCSHKECTLLTWDKPTGALCPKCNAPLVEKTLKRAQQRIIACSRSECDYRETIQAPEDDTPLEAVG